MEMTGTVEGAITERRIGVPLAGDIKLFGRAATKTKEGRLLTLWHANDVQARLPSPNQRLFTKQGCQFARLVFPHNRPRIFNDATCFLVRISRKEVAEESTPKKFGFANVDESPERIDHSINTGVLGCMRDHKLAQFSLDDCRRFRNGVDSLQCRVKVTQRWMGQKGVRPKIVELVNPFRVHAYQEPFEVYERCGSDVESSPPADAQLNLS